MGLFDFLKGSCRKNMKADRREEIRLAFVNLAKSLPPAGSLPEYPPYINNSWEPFTTGFTVVRGDAETVATSIWMKWEWHFGRTGPYGDPESARALSAFDQMLKVRSSSCSFPWGVNRFEYRLHRGLQERFMFVEVFVQRRE